MLPEPALHALIAAAAGGLLGWLCLWQLRRQDHRTWVLARAPALPVHALSVGDDAWLRGAVRHGQPLRCPWFDTACVAYRYERERLHTWTTRDKDGKVQHHEEWRTEASDGRSCDFWLDDGDRILVRSAGATNEALQSLGTDYQGSSLRHSASVLAVDAVVSVLAVKQDDGSFAAQREVPCLITGKTPGERVRSSARAEAGWFFAACLLPMLGAAGGVLVWDQRWRGDGPQALRMLAAAMVAWLPFWWIGSYNRLVRLRQQVLAAFRQVDVDLAVRARIAPNLIAVVRAAAAHEHELLAALAAIRSGLDPATTTAAERPAGMAARQVLSLHERYPALSADALYRDLHERLWACEEKLAHTRTLYNGIAREWNDRVQAFPSALVARLARCLPAPFFADDDAPLPPQLRR